MKLGIVGLRRIILKNLESKKDWRTLISILHDKHMKKECVYMLRGDGCEIYCDLGVQDDIINRLTDSGVKIALA